MGKYDPLRRYLSRQKVARVDLTFAEIERIIGAMLPKGATRAPWWADETSTHPTHVQAASWRAAGFGAVLVSGERVRFERTI